MVKRVCGELSLLISLYDKPVRLVKGGQRLIEVMETSDEEKRISLYKWT